MRRGEYNWVFRDVRAVLRRECGGGDTTYAFVTARCFDRRPRLGNTCPFFARVCFRSVPSPTSQDEGTVPPHCRATPIENFPGEKRRKETVEEKVLKHFSPSSFVSQLPHSAKAERRPAREEEEEKEGKRGH